MDDRGYFIKLRLSGESVASDLAGALRAHGAVVERDERVLTAVWPATEADDPDEWDEYTFAELIFFLRAWAGSDPARTLEVLEERPVSLGELDTRVA
jgi:hypothetical protein